MKICFKCKKNIALNSFYRESRNNNTLRKICKSCSNKRLREWRSPERISYYGAKNRCTNPKNKGYKNYGGRGIKFLFSSFNEFMKAVGQRPGQSSIDRIDNNGNYENGNVRWATKKDQNRNSRSASLTPDKIMIIRSLLKLTNDQKMISKKFGVLPSAISKIKTRRTWKDA